MKQGMNVRGKDKKTRNVESRKEERKYRVNMAYSHLIDLGIALVVIPY